MQKNLEKSPTFTSVEKAIGKFMPGSLHIGRMLKLEIVVELCLLLFSAVKLPELKEVKVAFSSI